MKTPDKDMNVPSKTPDMAKENNFVLREAAKAAQMGYYDHLAAGGKGDPAEERWIDALNAGADAITKVAVLESSLAQVERERDAAVQIVHGLCLHCKNEDSEGETCRECLYYPYRYVYGTGEKYVDNWQWRGVCPENTKEEEK